MNDDWKIDHMTVKQSNRSIYRTFLERMKKLQEMARACIIDVPDHHYRWEIILILGDEIWAAGRHIKDKYKGHITNVARLEICHASRNLFQINLPRWASSWNRLAKYRWASSTRRRLAKPSSHSAMMYPGTLVLLDTLSRLPSQMINSEMMESICIVKCTLGDIVYL